MQLTTLSPSIINKYFLIVINEMGATHGQQLQTILQHFDREIFTYGEVMELLYPTIETKKAQERFKQFQKKLREASEIANMRLELVVSGNKRTPNERSVYFVGQLPDAKEEQRRTLISTHQASENFIQADSIIQPLDNMPAKRRVRFFVSYCHEDDTLFEKFFKFMKPQFQLSKNYEYDIWTDKKIILNTDWHQSIQKEIQDCDFGLLLTSLNFFTSKYIKKHELGHYVTHDPEHPEQQKKAIPIALKKLDMELDLHGLEKKQIYFYKNKSFSECRGESECSDYASNLRKRIEKTLDYYEKSHNELAPATATRKTTPLTDTAAFKKHQQEILDQFEVHEKIVDTDGHITDLRHKDIASATSHANVNRTKAQDFLHQWATDPESAPFCAVLGEVGIGKTTNCKTLAVNLINGCEQNSHWPQPIYIDLRETNLTAHEKESIPPLHQILDRILEKCWQGGDSKMHFNHQTLFRLVQEEGALIIFDGLDEVLVHLAPSQGKEFIRQLWRILPPVIIDNTTKKTQHGKMLLSCRSHYFRDVWEQNSYLTGEGRDGIEAKRYQACILLPFTDEQILDYLKRNLPSADNQRVLGLIKNIHNLSEMAQRPVTLEMIAQQIPELEEKQLRGEVVRGVTLYQMMEKKWLHRDDGKHQFNIQHKHQIMESLAAAMWISGQKQWSVEKLDNWLIDTLIANPRWEYEYKNISPEVLKEDLRTATFIVRDDNDSFRFSHTSIQEYFLACYLLRALKEGTLDQWVIPMASTETLEFLQQLLEQDPQPKCTNSLKQLLETDKQAGTLMALRFYLMAAQSGLPLQPPTAAQLIKQNLENWVIKGQSGKIVNLQRANFSGSRLQNTQFEAIDLQHADFSGTYAFGSVWQQCDLQHTRFNKAELTGAAFRQCDLQQSIFDQARLIGSDWIDCQGTKMLQQAVNEDAANIINTNQDTTSNISNTSSPSRKLNSKEAFASLVESSDHTNIIKCVAYSPDGTLLASASYDHTVKLWNAHTGELIKSCVNHSNLVVHCAFSPDGTLLASASYDHTVKLWNAHTGELIKSCVNHSNLVVHCAFSPDGTLLASASDDKTVKLWNAHTGELIKSCVNHSNLVVHCAFSPDGTLLASASDDKTVKLWNARTGELIKSCENHSDRVRHCAFSPDGTLLASASDDKTVKLWNARSGELIKSCVNHSDLVRHCAFSPDGTLLASASDDKTVKLWNARSGELIKSCVNHSDLVRHCAFSPDGTLLASASDDKTVKLWNARSGELIKSCVNHSDRVRHCAFSPDGTLLASASDDKTVKLWNTRTGELIKSCVNHSDLVRHCAFSPDGTLLASASYDHTVKLWNARSGELIKSCVNHSDRVQHCAFSPDGTLLASASDDHTIKLWNARSGELIKSCVNHSDRVQHCAFSPDGTLLASASDDHTIKLWNARSGELIKSCVNHSDRVRHCAFSPDGTLLASASDDHTIKLWNARSGELIKSCVNHSDRVRHCAFSPDGTLLASASDDHTVKLWNAHTGELIKSCVNHSDLVRHCAFSPDGTLLASASDDKTVKLWNARSGELIKSCVNHSDLVRHCAFSPDGTLLASASDDKTVKLWNARTGELIKSCVNHSDLVRHCAFSPDGTLLASASDDSTAKLWSSKTGVCLKTFMHLPEKQWASYQDQTSVLDNSDMAWRYLNISAIDPLSKRLRRYPIEALRALPHKY